jgi:prevent-host-death family protein
MPINVNIAEAKAKLSELVAASLRGEEVTIQRAGRPMVRLVAVAEATANAKEELNKRRRAALGMYKDSFVGVDLSIEALNADQFDEEERWKRKFGSAD